MSFSNQVVEKLIYEGLKRKDMPQYENSLDDLKSYLDDKGILYTEEKVECSQLSPVQNEYSKNKVKGLKSKVSKGNISNLIVSEDYDILDGHHRWKAGEKLNKTVRLPVFRIHLPTHKSFVILDEAIKLMEKNLDEKNIITVYPGRFQPFHRGHFNTFSLLRDRFGRNDTYVATTNKTESERSPFSFQEKKNLITQLYDVPSRFVVEVENPYSPKEITKSYNGDEDVLIVGVGAKNDERIGRLTQGNYYKVYDPDLDLKPFSERGYVFPIKKEDEIQLDGNPISGSKIRELFRTPMPEERRKKLFEYVFGEFDQGIYELVNNKLTDGVVTERNILGKEELEFISQNINEEGLLKEAARTDAAIPADDGPASWYADPGDFENTEQNLARQMGYEVVDYMFSEKHFEGDPSDFKQDALKFVSFFPTGVFDQHVSDPLRIYRDFSEAVAETAGYEVMKHIGIDEPEEKESVTDDGGAEDETQQPEGETGGIAALEESVEKKVEDIRENDSTSHLRHPYEDLSLTFGDIKGLIQDTVRGELNSVREKTDGQNLKVTWKDGLRAARTKGDLKQEGADSMKRGDLVEKFEGRGEVKNAFVKAFDDLEKTLGRLPKDILEDVFSDGKRFLSLEVIYGPTQNVVSYGEDMLVFQEVNTYDSGGSLKARNEKLAGVLNESLGEYGFTEGETFKVRSQPEVNLFNLEDDKEELVRELCRVVKEQKEKYGLNDSDPILKCIAAKWRRFIDYKCRQFDVDPGKNVKKGLVKRWAFGEKSGENGYSLRSLKADVNNEQFLSYLLEFDDKYVRGKFKEIRKPFEYIFLRLGGEVLCETEFPLIKNREKAVSNIKNRVKESIQKVKSLDNEAAESKLNKELKRIKLAGGLEKLCPSEGVVFNSNGELYKLTGLFSPINQILGLIKYQRF